MAPITVSKGLKLLQTAKTSAKKAVKDGNLKKVESKITETKLFTSEAKVVEVSAEEVEQMIKENPSIYYHLTGKPLPTCKKQQIRTIYAKITNSLMLNMGKYTKGFSVESLTKDFATKKQALIREMESVLTPQQLNRIKKAKTPEELTNALFSEEYPSYSKLINASKDFPKGRIPLEYEQMNYQARIQRGKYILAREKAMHIPSTNPQVIAIENILKEQYGVTFVSLKNDENMAKKVLKAFETAKKNGIKTPKRVVVSDFMFAEGENIATENMILLASKEAQNTTIACSVKAMSELSKTEKGVFSLVSAFPNSHQLSTTCSEHVPLHEIIHSTHPPLNAFAQKKIPARMMNVKENTSLYSAIAPTCETYTELATKKALVGLNTEETELFNYLNFYG